MRFAHFSHVWAKAGMTPHQRYEQLWRELALCDELGFDYGFSVEHHFTRRESWMSSPNSLTAASSLKAPRSPWKAILGDGRGAVTSIVLGHFYSNKGLGT